MTQTVTINGWDAAGNYAAGLSFDFIADNVAPVIDVRIQVAADDDGQTRPWCWAVRSATAGRVLRWRSRCMHPAEITLVNAARSGDTWWYETAAATPGLYTLWVIATDLAGNRSAKGPYSLEVTCLPAAPTIASILVEPASGVTGTVTITTRLNNTGGELPAGLLVGFFANGVPVATAAAPALAAGQGVTLTVAWPDVYGGDFDLRVVPNVPSTSGSLLPLCAAPESLNRTVSTQDLVLNSAWNLISTNINPQNPDITVVQRPISGTYATIQSFDQGALSYYPQVPAPLNTLRTIDALHGYWIRVTASPPVTTTLEAARLLVVGEAVPDTTPLALDAGWNLISYLPRSSRTVSEALTNINGYYSAVLGFRGGALSYYPDLPPEINSLKSLEPGYGYWLKTSQAITLVYSATVPGGLVVESAAGIGRGPQIAALAAVQNLRYDGGGQ